MKQEADEDPLFAAALPETEAPEMPEAYLVLLRLRDYKTTYTAGGYEDQPHILMMEFEACIRAENSNNARLAANLRQKQNAQNA